MLEFILYGLYAILTAFTVYGAWKLMRAFRQFQPKVQPSENLTLKQLPTVSVCVPARNEHHAMTACLERLVASDYPKLEILVLDDSSQDETPVLIRSFAQSGVRFIKGKALPEGWLGKNHALQGLLEEASGQLVLFADVDTQLQPDSITKLVNYMQNSNLDMVSGMPMRFDGKRPSVVLGTLRYFWAILRHSNQHPAVSSSAWMINKHLLDKELGGITPFKAKSQPEVSIAAKLTGGAKYQFLLDRSFGIGFEKKWTSQLDSSIRLLFGFFGGKLLPNLVVLMVLLAVNSPTFVVLTAFIDGWTIVHSVALWQLSIFMALYAIYTSKIWAKGWWIGALLWPLVAFQELVVLTVSIYRHLTHSVSWKGRPVTAKTSS